MVAAIIAAGVFYALATLYDAYWTFVGTRDFGIDRERNGITGWVMRKFGHPAQLIKTIGFDLGLGVIVAYLGVLALPVGAIVATPVLLYSGIRQIQGGNTWRDNY